MDKIYWSVTKDPEEWTPMKSYWFPFAERLYQTRFRRIVLAYVAFRMWFEK